MAVLSCELV
jgi:hypothetical protein